MSPGFSERTFEFCYNLEYFQSNAAILASHPHIPSQLQEKDLGYDVEFLIRTKGYTRSLFLQHKVSHFAESRAGRNARFYDRHQGPYFRFNVDNDQHNVLRELSNKRGNAFYCAPRFHLRHQLETHFRGPSVIQSSILLDPLDVDSINDDERHNVTYGPNGQSPTLHSDPKSFKEDIEGKRGAPASLNRQIVDEAYVDSLAEELISRTRESKFRSSITSDVERSTSIQKAQILLAKVYDVTWLLLP